MLEQKLNLKWAMDKKLSKIEVKEFFISYDEAYKRLRNPSEKHYQEYKNLYFKYLEYMNKSSDEVSK